MLIRKILQTIVLTFVIFVINGITLTVFANVGARSDFNSPDALWQEIRQDMVIRFDDDNPAVQRQIAWYQQHPKFLYKILSHSRDLLHYVHTQMRDCGLPAEIALIPIIESHYNPTICAKSGAAGLWQMMPGTARKYGLKVNRSYDGRKDVEASTQAAIQYLSYLHRYFNGNWLLALAGYELGEHKVRSIAWRQESDDFWNLALPRHTRTYVPKLLAIAAIIKDPAQYNISLPSADTYDNDDWQQAAETSNKKMAYKIRRGDNLAKIAKKFHMSLAQLKELNPNINDKNLKPGQKINLNHDNEA